LNNVGWNTSIQQNKPEIIKIMNAKEFLKSLNVDDDEIGKSISLKLQQAVNSDAVLNEEQTSFLVSCIRQATWDCRQRKATVLHIIPIATFINTCH
jgi:hypothetical protein